MPLRNAVKAKWIPFILSVFVCLSFSACSSCRNIHEDRPVPSDSDLSTVSTESITVPQEPDTAVESGSETWTESIKTEPTEAEPAEAQTYNDYGEWDRQ